MNNIHGYVVRDLKQIPWLFALERVVKGDTTYNLTAMIVNVARTYGGLSKQKIRDGLIAFGQMGFLFFKEQSQVWPFNSSTNMHPSICWMSMLGSTKRVFKENKPLVTKMAMDTPNESIETKNFLHASWVVEYAHFTLLNAHVALCEFPHLLAQSPTYYIVDFIYAAHICQMIHIDCMWIQPLLSMERFVAPLDPW